MRKPFPFALKHCWTATCWILAVAGPSVCHVGLNAQEVALEKSFSQPVEVLKSVVAGGAADESQPKPEDPKAIWSKGPSPVWIWGPENKSKYFFKQTIPGGSKSARLRATCDNEMTVFINGQKVAESKEWSEPKEVDIQPQLKAGDNELLIAARDQGGAAALIVKIALTSADGKTEYIASSPEWSVAETRDAKEWTTSRAVAKLGEGPWGDVFFASTSPVSDAELFHLLPGFQIERIFTVPKEQLGSWVNITADSKGRLIVSDQGNLGLCRVTPPPVGSTEPAKVERLDVKIDGKTISGAQGLLFAFDSLYVCCNGGPGSGLYRLKDTNGDDQFDEAVRLKDFRGGGEHGPHALRLSPDGKSIYVCAGNHTLPTFDRTTNAEIQRMGGPRAEQLKATLPEGITSRILPVWDEDVLLPRQWDAGGHAVGILAPGGWIAKTDPDAKTWEMLSIGYRNQFDFDLNADGEMFAYDADMEWDVGSSWYRPTRVVHATSGSEFGWRSGTAKWPAYYADSLPAVIDIGPGSPVGVDFGYGAKFPAKYQKALYICDWTFATMYAIHLEPEGSTYKAVKEEFVSRTPLPLTDVTIGSDGAMYFTIGGRGAQSELFRVTYVGNESTAPAELRDPRHADLRALRHKIEALHVETPDVKQADFLIAHLGHSDRFIRYAARVALERMPTSAWQEKVLSSTNVETVITGTIGLAHAGDHVIQSQVLTALDKLDWTKLSHVEKIELLRAYQLVFIRLGALNEEARSALGAKLEALFPADNDSLNRELAVLMVYLETPNAAHKLVPYLTKERVASQAVPAEVLARNKGYGGSIAAMLANQPDQQQMHYAFTLRNLKTGWTIAERKTYFQWYDKAQQWSGGNSYRKFLVNMDKDAFANCTDAERLALEALGARTPYKAPELPKAKGPGKAWKLDEVIALATQKLKGRNFKEGQIAFAAARCVVCHRFSGDGGSTGPDLTQLAGRFSLKDLTEAIVEPSKVISDQYKASVIQTTGGQVHTGRIVSETADAVTMVINPEDATKTLEIKKSEIDEQTVSKVSLMPVDLLNSLNENEVLDLLAYLLSRGDPGNAMFSK